MDTVPVEPTAPADLFTPAGFARLLASPRARAFQLRLMAHAEETDEGVFDELIRRVDVPELNKLVAIHADDERRHAELLHGCAERTGIAPEPIPLELHFIERLRRLSGGGDMQTIFANGDTSIMHVFAMLMVVEERGVRQFPLVEQALRAVDPESADTLAAIIRDEQRHVGYARAISRRYAPDEATLEQVLTLCREVEAIAFTENQEAFRHFVSERGFWPT